MATQDKGFTAWCKSVKPADLPVTLTPVCSIISPWASLSWIDLHADSTPGSLECCRAAQVSTALDSEHRSMSIFSAIEYPVSQRISDEIVHCAADIDATLTTNWDWGQKSTTDPYSDATLTTDWDSGQELTTDPYRKSHMAATSTVSSASDPSLAPIADEIEPQKISHSSDRWSVSGSTSFKRHIGRDHKRGRGYRSRSKRCQESVDQRLRVVKSYKYNCDHPGIGGVPCTARFSRRDHLARHLSCHERPSFECPFKTIGCETLTKDRLDNLYAHLRRAHFTYNQVEWKGKTKRVSMRASHEAGLIEQDPRWDLLLRNKMRFGDSETQFYKMLGYSVKDTTQIAVRDIAPSWKGQKGRKLSDLDPRWKHLKSGKMSFDEAMIRGRHMPETEAEGVLGINMFTSQEMGLESLDPRWKRLKDGTMDMPTKELLGVATWRFEEDCY